MEEEYKSELEIQQKVYTWFYNTWKKYRLPAYKNKPRSLLVHNLLNPKSVVEGAKLQGCGLTKGFPDLSLYIAKAGYHGLHIELKMPGKKARPEQWDVLHALEEQGYKVVVCDNHNDAIWEIDSYLKLKH